MLVEIKITQIQQEFGIFYVNGRTGEKPHAVKRTQVMMPILKPWWLALALKRPGRKIPTIHPGIIAQIVKRTPGSPSFPLSR
jgi:hypothetical protein